MIEIRRLWRGAKQIAESIGFTGRWWSEVQRSARFVVPASAGAGGGFRPPLSRRWNRYGWEGGNHDLPCNPGRRSRVTAVTRALCPGLFDSAPIGPRRSAHVAFQHNPCPARNTWDTISSTEGNFFAVAIASRTYVDMCIKIWSWMAD